MKALSNAIAWYQKKIGTYDKQLWEQSVEATVLQNIELVPRRLTKLKTDLIDVDLVRGSTFPKAKPQDGNFIVSLKGLLRVVFFPLFLRWWRHQTTPWVTGLLLFLYIAQITVLVTCAYDTRNHAGPDKLSLGHVYVPVFAMCLLGLVHAHIVASFSTHRTRVTHRSSRKKRAKKEHLSKSSSGDSLSSAKPRPASPSAAWIGPIEIQSYLPDDSTHHGDIEDSVVASSGLRKRKLRKRTTSNMNEERFYESLNNGATTHPNQPLAATSKSCDAAISQTGAIRTLEDRQGLEVKPRRRMGRRGLEVTGSESESGICNSHTSSKSESETGYEAAACGYMNAQACDYMNKPRDHESKQNSKQSSIDCENQHHTPYFSHEYANIELLKPSCDAKTQILTQNSHCDMKNEESHQSTCDFDTHVNTHFPCNSHEDKDLNEYVFRSASVPETPVYMAGPREEICAMADESASHDPENTEGEMIVLNAQSDTAVNTLIQDSTGIQEMSFSVNTHAHRPRTLLSAPDLQPRTVRHRVNRLGRTPRLWVETDEDFGLDSEGERHATEVQFLIPPKRFSSLQHKEESSAESDSVTTPVALSQKSLTSEAEWEDTMNSGDMTTDSSTTECDNESDGFDTDAGMCAQNEAFNIHHATSVMNKLASSSDKVSCMIWTRDEVHKVDLSVLDLGWAIIKKADCMPESADALWVPLVNTLILAFLPLIFRIYIARAANDVTGPSNQSAALSNDSQGLGYGLVYPGDDVNGLSNSSVVLSNETLSVLGNLLSHLQSVMGTLFGGTCRENLIILNGVLQRFCLAAMFFFLLSVAERTFKQRLIYAKHFCYLTSSRRARKYDMPHFRLNKVRNIKTWLSLRSYLRKRGPQRSVDSIVSATFFLAVILFSLMCVQLLHDSEGFLDYLSNWELLGWCLALGLYLLRFMTMGSNINRKYRNFSVLITEQINLYLHMEQKPHKKDELTLAQNVLKLAEALLKELENPFRISGLSFNPFLYNLTKLVLLSAFSAVLTELLGFKLKLYKIKLK